MSKFKHDKDMNKAKYFLPEFGNYTFQEQLNMISKFSKQRVQHSESW